MIQYKPLNVKLSNLQLSKLKSAIKNLIELALNLLSNLIGGFNDETNFPQKLFLSDTQVSKIRKAFANGSSANITFSKTQLSKMILSRGILGVLIETRLQVMFLAGKEALKKVYHWYQNYHQG